MNATVAMKCPHWPEGATAHMCQDCTPAEIAWINRAPGRYNLSLDQIRAEMAKESAATDPNRGTPRGVQSARAYEMGREDVKLRLESLNAGLQEGLGGYVSTMAGVAETLTRKAEKEREPIATSTTVKCPYVTCSWVSGTVNEHMVHMKGHAKRAVLTWACLCGSMGEGHADVPHMHVRPNGEVCSILRPQVAGGGPEVGLQRDRTFTRTEVLLILRAMLASNGGVTEAIQAFERME